MQLTPHVLNYTRGVDVAILTSSPWRGRMYLTVIFSNVFRGPVCWVNGRRMYVWSKTRLDKYGERIVYHENVVDSCGFWEVKRGTKNWQGHRKCIHKSSMSHAITVLFCVTSVVLAVGFGVFGLTDVCACEQRLEAARPAWHPEQLREEAREAKVEKRRGKDLSKAKREENRLKRNSVTVVSVWFLLWLCVKVLKKLSNIMFV
jgi:preprotein translocase subunit SecG